MGRIAGWIYVVALLSFTVVLLSPTGTRARAAQARDAATANLEQVIAHARACQREGRPVTRERLNSLLAQMDWPTGQVSYSAWAGVTGGPHRWVVWAEPTVHESSFDRVRPWRHVTVANRLCVRSWELDNGVQQEGLMPGLVD